MYLNQEHVCTVDIYRFYMNTVIIVNTEQKGISLKITYFLFGEILSNYPENRLPQFIYNTYIMHIQYICIYYIIYDVIYIMCVYEHFCRHYEKLPV